MKSSKLKSQKLLAQLPVVNIILQFIQLLRHGISLFNLFLVFFPFHEKMRYKYLFSKHLFCNNKRNVQKRNKFRYHSRPLQTRFGCNSTWLPLVYYTSQQYMAHLSSFSSTVSSTFSTTVCSTSLVVKCLTQC